MSPDKMDIDAVETASAAVPADSSLGRQLILYHRPQNRRQPQQRRAIASDDRRRKKQSSRMRRRNAISGPSTGTEDWFDIPKSMLTPEDKLLIAINRIPTIIQLTFKTGFSFPDLSFIDKEATMNICRVLALKGQLAHFEGDANRIIDFMRLLLDECERFKHKYEAHTLTSETAKQKRAVPAFFNKVAELVSKRQNMVKGKGVASWMDEGVKGATCEVMLNAFIGARKAYLKDMAKDGEGDNDDGDGGGGGGAQEATYTRKTLGLIMALDHWIAFTEEKEPKSEAKRLAWAIDRFEM
ncbi:hypothetical protein CORC01_02978 [Colletotrichum orchidophilum]|uniref:Uncharacterized protein n=1 Tax=Colletotrichum orchidophilum TaxID=1209926 RepID=A0A1G4BKG7_9PEZI|nr:uncharacterized protein CORC01_02978 [Colletotrichum orchidophilum]OHF01787.1 hypothetical protein CORC01_02978 [Colletotrichum orchidophilum]